MCSILVHLINNISNPFPTFIGHEIYNVDMPFISYHAFSFYDVSGYVLAQELLSRGSWNLQF